MSRFTIFVGGCHGVGKGRMCKLLKREIICDYVSASSLLNWKSVTKEVQNIDFNQKLLSVLLPQALKADKVFTVDGHFALRNQHGDIECIHPDLFRAFMPEVLIVLVDNPIEITERIKKRDGIDYDVNEIGRLQEKEIEGAKIVSETIGAQLYIVEVKDEEKINSVMKAIKESMNKYTRQNIYSEMLKTVIMRFDFSGGTNILQFVDLMKQDDLIKNAFGSLRVLEQRSSGPKETPEVAAGLLPTFQKQNSTIYRFSDCKYDPGLGVILDIASDFVCLTIDCRTNYNGSKQYTDLIASLMIKLKEYDSFVSLGRIGIRKIDAKVLNEGERLEDFFNENYIAIESWNKFPKDRVNCTDFFSIGKVRFNVVQQIDRNEEGIPRAIYDVDAYLMDKSIDGLLTDKDGLIHFLNEDMQDKMFELFVSCASKDYLEKCKQAKLLQ